MMSVSTIKEINREQAQRAAESGETPFVYFNATEVEEYDGFPFPHIGDHRPDGWTLVDEHFVDSSGFGRPGEPALTGDEFKDLIAQRIDANRPAVTGWAIIEAGQFQVYVGEFTRPSDR